MEYGIGEFSKMARVTVKTLRFYHEEGLVLPCRIAPSGYRYYDAAALDRVALVGRLKDWEFSLKEIREIVDSCVDDKDLGPRLLSQARHIAAEAVRYTRIRHEIEQFQKTLEVEPMGVSVESLSEQVLPDLLVVSLRFRGPDGALP